MQGRVTSPGGVSGGASIGVKTQDLGGARRGASGVRRVKLAHSQHRGPRGVLAGGPVRLPGLFSVGDGGAPDAQGGPGWKVRSFCAAR